MSFSFLSKKLCKGFEKSQNSRTMQRKKCKARKMLKNDTLDAKIGVDKAANEPRKGSENCFFFFFLDALQ
jgi:hypothetical protein